MKVSIGAITKSDTIEKDEEKLSGLKGNYSRSSHPAHDVVENLCLWFSDQDRYFSRMIHDPNSKSIVAAVDEQPITGLVSFEKRWGQRNSVED